MRVKEVTKRVTRECEEHSVKQYELLVTMNSQVKFNVKARNFNVTEY